MAKKQYVVIGLGRFGFALAKTLYENDADVLAIDKDMDLVNAIAPFCTQACGMDATDEKGLEKLGISNMDEAIVCTASDIQSNIFICLNLLNAGLKVSAKAWDENHKIVLERIGVHNVIIPEQEMGVKMAEMMASPNMIEVLSLSEHFSIVEIRPPKKWLGKTVLELDLRNTEQINVIAIKRSDKIITDVKNDTGFDEDDIVLVYGSEENTERLRSKAKNSVYE